ncbi:MAG: SH3 domain-containing protein, partial [Shimia sp.]|nr:SH3 domain-containing protein [Shimia sp.]
MNKFVVVSFAFMAWAFYELSGGSDFEPKNRHEIAEVQPQKSLVSTEPARITPTSIEPVVTKAAAVVPT